ncbi:MAG: hypothetical protein HZA91_11790 [Verrucomicrobia bacterium]|nr:hypothetical protein [Verrucomicrobiota bacterium]
MIWPAGKLRGIHDAADEAAKPATVLVPAKTADAITESGKPLAKATGVKFLRMEGDRAVLEAEAGSCRFAGRGVR